MTTTHLAPAEVTDVSTPELAGWGRRVVAALLDGAVLGAAAWFVAGGAIEAPTLHLTFGATEVDGPAPATSSAVLVAAWLLMLVLQGLTGQTPGRRVLGIQVVRAPVDGQVGGPPGVLRSVGRWFAHLLDAILLIGYLRPLWHHERRTFADGIVGTLVVRRPPTPRDDRRGRAVTAGAAVVVVVGVLAGVEVGTDGGMERVGEERCALSDQGRDAPVRVREILLVRDVEWHRGLRAWPWAGEAWRSERTTVAAEIRWDVRSSPGWHDPDAQLLMETVTDGIGEEHPVPLSDEWARVPLTWPQGTDPVEVEVRLDGRSLTSCSAAVPPGG